MSFFVVSSTKTTWAAHTTGNSVYLTAKARAVGSKIFDLVGGVGYSGPSREHSKQSDEVMGQKLMMSPGWVAP